MYIDSFNPRFKIDLHVTSANFCEIKKYNYHLFYVIKTIR